ncbi:MAG: hypothetical protein NW200_04430 [Hyphomonadaceae bacterium]|nr:hypothetical protein [Hyphomonadaceae bacterium]
MTHVPRWPVFRWRGCALAGALALAACQPPPAQPSLPRGDEILPGAVEVAGLSHCDAARLELAAVVLNGPPKAAALEDVSDATAPGCTWVAADGAARVRLNVYDETLFPALGIAGPDPQFAALADTYASQGEATALTDLGVRAARYGFTGAAPADGVIVVLTPTRVLEFQGRGVSAPKLLIFARSVTETMEKAP